MHILGMAGHMRRLYDPTQYDFLKPYQPMNEFISVCAFLLFATQAIFALNFVISLFRGRKAELNPWHDNGLEWTLPSPAPHGNWKQVPSVYRGPYEFSSPLVAEDYLPQTQKLPTDQEPAVLAGAAS
jgi:cytochrome c oxidase subunit I